MCIRKKLAMIACAAASAHLLALGAQPALADFLLTGTATAVLDPALQNAHLGYVAPDAGYILFTAGPYPSKIYTSTLNTSTHQWETRRLVQSGFGSGSIGPDGYLYSRNDLAGSKIYRAAPTGTLTWASPVNLNLANAPYHQQFPYFDGQGLYFMGSPTGGNDGDLYYASYNPAQSKFQAAQPLTSLNDPGAHDVSPWVSADGLTMLFASNRSGGYGGLDLYTARRESTDSNTWADITNLGPAVNGPGDEFSAIYAPNSGTLYYHRTGTGTMQILVARQVVSREDLTVLSAIHRSRGEFGSSGPSMDPLFFVDKPFDGSGRPGGTETFGNNIETQSGWQSSQTWNPYPVQGKQAWEAEALFASGTILKGQYSRVGTKPGNFALVGHGFVNDAEWRTRDLETHSSGTFGLDGVGTAPVQINVQLDFDSTVHGSALEKSSAVAINLIPTVVSAVVSAGGAPVLEEKLLEGLVKKQALKWAGIQMQLVSEKSK